MRTRERPETRGEQEARLARLSDEADAGAFDHFLERAIAHRSYPKGTRLTTEGSSDPTRRCRIM